MTECSLVLGARSAAGTTTIFTLGYCKGSRKYSWSHQKTDLDSKDTVNWVQELQAIVSRAALQSPESAQQLPEEVFWFATQPKDRLKWNLLSPGAFPWLKPFLRRFASIASNIIMTFWARCISNN